MPQVTHQAVFVGGVAMTFVVAFRIVATSNLSDGSKPLPFKTQVARTSLIFMQAKGIVVYLLFAGLSFAFADQLVASALGIALLFGMSVVLALGALEELMVPELRRFKSPLHWIVAAFGAVAYSYAAVSSI
jgi:hypothetical protein